jgi:CBS domain-containing protein
MEAEIVEIQTFLLQYPPFDSLPEEAVKHAAHHLEIAYYRAGKTILSYGEQIDHLYIVRSGVVETYRRNGELHNRLDQGNIFGEMGLLMNNRVRFSAAAITDTLVYCLPDTIFTEFCDTYEQFSDFVELEDSTRLRLAVTTTNETNSLTTSKIKTLLHRDAVILSRHETVQQAAQTMLDENVSAVLINDPGDDGEEEPERPFVGILTDRDLCTRILAPGISHETPIDLIMSTELFSLDHNAYISEAMLTMLRGNIRHLPILRDKQPIGLVDIMDIVRYESQSSLLLVNSIFAQTTVEDLTTLAQGVKNCFTRMVNEDANSHMIGSAMSVIGRSFIQRLTELAEERYGPPPVPYCFLTMGSMARDEQLIVTDQDNALILDESYDPNLHEPYFEILAAFVCDGLAACGYDYCDGEIMATNSEWRKTLSGWQECFADWIDNPNPQALLNSSIFFDLAGAAGLIKWAEQLKTFVVRRARKNNRFLACLARNALNRTPPLGFFKNFVMEKDGRHNHSINLKRRGTAPLADIARVHALAVGSRSQNSFDRLDDVIEAGILPKGRGADLREAMEYISMVRIRHQALDINTGIEPDNTIDPDSMSDFERRNLKDAFQILSNAQNFLKFRYTASRFELS